MSTAYARAERRLLNEYALSVLADPKASPRDREAAQRRLECDTREPDLKRLTTDELRESIEAMRTYARLMAKARGDAVVERPSAVADVEPTVEPQPVAAPVTLEAALAEPAPEPAPQPYTLASLGLGR